MLRFTLDTNCVTDVDEGRPDSVHIMELAKAHREGRAEVAVVAMMASEKQRSGTHLENFVEFSKRLKNLELDGLNLAPPLCYLDMCFLNHCLLASDELSALDEKIHCILFPGIELNFTDFCLRRGLDVKAGFTGEAHKWRNLKCDVQAMWSHIHRGGDVFVTRDKCFHRNSAKLIAIGAGRILTPGAAVGSSVHLRRNSPLHLPSIAIARH